MTKNNKTIAHHDLSAGVFIRGLVNLKNQLRKAEQHITTTGASEAELLSAPLAINKPVDGASYAPADLHMYSLAAQVHWAAEGAKLAIKRLLGEHPIPIKSDEKSFADLYQSLDQAITYIREVAPSDLESALDKTIVIDRPSGTMNLSGRQFLLAYAIPHFFYHVSTAYGILRNQGVHLTMGDYLGNWGEN